MLMRFREAAGDLLHDRNRFLERKRPALHPLPESLALVVRHGDEGLALLGLTDLVDDADVGMIEGGRGFRLLDEALAQETIARGFARDVMGGKKLEGDQPVELEIARLEDDAHTPAAELLEDLVVGYGLSDHDGRKPARGYVLAFVASICQADGLNGSASPLRVNQPVTLRRSLREGRTSW